ncbi:MAG TPA: hypothetical protein VH054_10410, partial [Polyangiaceae bacterium]|nr:hypothetical protein [Polyangiaceae bacterium]
MTRRLLVLGFAALMAQCDSNNPPGPSGPQPYAGEEPCDPQAVTAFLMTFDPPWAAIATSG